MNNPYVVFYIKRKLVYEHRYLMEKIIGRPLEKGEVVHHINGDRKDNRIENLQLMNMSEHASKHNLTTLRTPTCKTCSTCHQLLPLSSFSHDKKNIGNKRSNCKKCQVIYNRLWFERNRKK